MVNAGRALCASRVGRSGWVGLTRGAGRGEGSPGRPLLEMLRSSRTGAGTEGEPWGSQGQALLKRAVGKS